MIESAARKLATELVNRRESINRELSRNGVRFGIYKDGEYHDRLFPYDPIPRIIDSNEFDEMEAGLKQRVDALNAYLRDVYSDKKVIKDGIIPEEYVYTSAGYFPQVNGVTPPGGVFAHIAGEDLVQGQDGKWWVLEDNLRIPSGALVMTTSTSSPCMAPFISFSEIKISSLSPSTVTKPKPLAFAWNIPRSCFASPLMYFPFCVTCTLPSFSRLSMTALSSPF